MIFASSDLDLRFFLDGLSMMNVVMRVVKSVLWEHSQFCSQLDPNKVAHKIEAEEMLYLEGLIIPRILDEELI